MDSNSARQLPPPEVLRPDVYGYHDYREYLKDLVGFLRETKGLSMREISRQSGISGSYLSMVISGERRLSAEQLGKLSSVAGLERSEASYLEWLIELNDASDQESRFTAIKKIQRFRRYQNLNPLEIEAYRYLEHWYHVAIRELAQLPDFNPDPKWIQKALRYKVSLIEIKQSLEFLVEHGFLLMNPQGQIAASDKAVHCKTGMLKPALTRFHGEMLQLAITSLSEVPSTERNVSAFTGALPQDKMDEVRAILDEARTKILALANSSMNAGADTVYHIGFLAIPLTNKLEEES